MPVSPTSTKFRAENPQKTARPPWDQDQRQVDPTRLFPQSDLGQPKSLLCLDWLEPFLQIPLRPGLNLAL